MYHIYIYTIYIYVPYMYQSEIFSTSDKQMVFNLCIPLPDEPIETSGNLLSVQFTHLVSKAMVKFHMRKHIIVSIILLDRLTSWKERGESVKKENNSRSSNVKRWAGYKQISKIDA